MRRDSLREYLQVAVEMYNLAATPQANHMYRDTVDEVEPVDAPRMPTDVRMRQLQMSIDIKYIFNRFINALPPKRAERFVDWVQVGYIERFHSEHREQLRADRKALARCVSIYRTGRTE